MNDPTAAARTPTPPAGQQVDPAALERQGTRLILQLQSTLALYVDIVDALRARVLELEGKK